MTHDVSSGLTRLLEAIDAFGGDDLRDATVKRRLRLIDDDRHSAHVKFVVARTIQHPYDGWLRALDRDDVPSQDECALAYLNARTLRSKRERRRGLAHFLMLCSAYSAAPIMLHDVPDEFDLVGSYLSGGMVFASMLLRSIEASDARHRSGIFTNWRTYDVTAERLHHLARSEPEFEVYRRMRRQALEDLIDALTRRTNAT